MTKKQKKNLRRILIALGAFLIVIVTDKILGGVFGDKFPNGLASILPYDAVGWLLPFVLYFAIYLYIGYDVLKKSAINIAHGQVFDENFLMAVATIGAFGLGIYTGITEHNPEGFDEACAVLLFYQVGEWFQAYAVGKSRKSITELMNIRPDYACVIRDDGTVEKVDPTNVKIGDKIVVYPGEKIPLDGKVEKGASSLDTKALTGESLPVGVSEGDEVMSGAINLASTLEIIVEKEFGQSTVSKILDLVENASSEKSRSENFITKFAKYYTPIVVFSALALAFVPPIVNGINGNWNTFADWIYRALSFLVVSCPCALVISVPLSFFAGIGGASKKGILVKGSVYLEKFDKANIFVFDKTGTLTKGNFVVTEVYPENRREEILSLAAAAEKQSSHPIAVSIKAAYGKESDEDYVIENVAGKGIKAVGSGVVLCGNEKMMIENGVDYTPANGTGTVVYVAKDGKFVGYVLIADEVKDEAKDTIEYLSSIGAKTVMLTGDNEKIARHVAKTLGMTEVKAGLLPQNKVEEVAKMLAEKGGDEVLCFIGDGINDAPVLMRSDIGVSMGGVGSDAAIEASDIVLMNDNLARIGTAKKIARKTMRIVYENIIFALAVKVAILILSAFGIATMWIAVFGDVGVAVIAILNSMRASSVKD